MILFGLNLTILTEKINVTKWEWSALTSKLPHIFLFYNERVFIVLKCKIKTYFCFLQKDLEFSIQN